MVHRESKGKAGATTQDELDSNKIAPAAGLGNEPLMTLARVTGKAGEIYSVDMFGYCIGDINRKVGSTGMHLIDECMVIVSPHEDRTHPNANRSSWSPTPGGDQKAAHYSEMMDILGKSTSNLYQYLGVKEKEVDSMYSAVWLWHMLKDFFGLWMPVGAPILSELEEMITTNESLPPVLVVLTKSEAYKRGWPAPSLEGLIETANQKYNRVTPQYSKAGALLTLVTTDIAKKRDNLRLKNDS